MIIVNDKQIEAIMAEIKAEILRRLGISVTVDAGVDDDGDLIFITVPFPLDQQELYNEIVTEATRKILKIGYG